MLLNKTERNVVVLLNDLANRTWSSSIRGHFIMLENIVKITAHAYAKARIVMALSLTVCDI